MSRIETFSRQAHELGESPLWSAAEQALYWLDIGSKTLNRQALADATARSWQLPDHPGCLAEVSAAHEATKDTTSARPATVSTRQGVIAMAMGEGFHAFDLESGRSNLLAATPPRPAGTRFNDGKVDPRGRFWAGTMQNNFGPAGEALSVNRFDGALYRFDPDGSVQTVEEQLGIPNTLAWSPDQRKFYFGDTLRGWLWVYDFDADSGRISSRAPFFRSHVRGDPDGSAMDVDGCLWNARWDGSALLRITPAGRLDRVIELPVPRPTSCAFGGPDLSTLFVTSARNGLSPSQLAEYPLSGSVLAIHGLPQGAPVPSATIGEVFA